MLNTPKYSGEPTPQALASGLATLGRYGDEFMVHAAEGETVIPPEIFEANPQLKADLFRQMAMMGIKDPNRYVVGNSLNSINPLTGQPEFFFKKIFKSIKKVFKKALPIIAPILGNIIAPGIGGIIASGLVTKMQGGSWGDVLKGAAVSWAGQGLMSGIGGAMSSVPGDTFMGGLSKGLTAPFSAASNLFSSGPTNPFSQGIFGSSKALAGAGPLGKTLTPEYNPDAGAAAISDGMTDSGDLGTSSISPTSENSVDLSSGFDAEVMTRPLTAADVELQTYNPANTEGAYSSNYDPRLGTGADVRAAPQEIVQASSGDGEEFFGNVGKKVTALLDPTIEGAQAAQVKALDSSVAQANALRKVPMNAADELVYRTDWAKANPLPGLLSRSTPLLGIAGVGIAAASGAFSEEEEEFNANSNKSDREIDAYAKWGQIQDKNSLEAQKLFGIWNIKPYETRRAFERATGGPSLRPDWRFLPESNTMTAAMGGEVVGPGTGTSDSIPARLSDGEFVMTADAVQNAGGGNRDLGAARMYDMMRRFEGGVA
jgi:hypothetical protein